MVEATPALFDFSPFLGKSGSYVQTLREFAAGSAFRSATVDELVLDDDFCRRPLRPEDLSFLKFTKPVRDSTVSRLPSLASQRILNSLYELTSAVRPEAGSHRLPAFEEFANDRNRQYAVQLTPFLEAYAFEYLGSCIAPHESPMGYSGRLGRIYADEYQFWIRLLGQMKATHYLQEALCFSFIQRWCLAPSVRRVFATARDNGMLDGLSAAVEPQFESDLLDDTVISRIAANLGVDRLQHSYWQFYLATSLSKSNLLYALCRRVDRPFALYGAAYAAHAEWLAFKAAIAQFGQHISGNGAAIGAAELHLDRLLRNVELALQFVQKRHPRAAYEMGQGLAAAAKLADRARWDLGEQLKWLSAIDRYCEHARTISKRIDRECPDIDRETFVEPREMCSTTHVHDDHRLVTIQEGIMHFWGNLGMRLEMHTGDMVLIPEGRLHGSTVLSPECTYHQPIIPDEWVRELTDSAPMLSGGRRREEVTIEEIYRTASLSGR